MSRPLVRPLLAALLLLLAVLGACSDVAPAAPPGSSTPSPRPASTPAPFDLGAVIRQVRLAFRPVAGAGLWAGGAATYDATASEERLEITPRVGGAAPIALETTAIGRGVPLRVARGGASAMDDGHLAIDRGAAVEHLRNTGAGLHQSFRFAAPPPGAGDLEVRIRVAGAAYAGTTAAGHHFRDAASGASIRYGLATWVDARGRRTAMEVRHLGGGELALVVPEGVLVASAYPAEIDPLISPQINLDQPVVGDACLGQTLPAIAFDGTNYLVVWHDTRGIDGTFTEIYGARVSAAGVLLDPGGLLLFKSGSGGKPPAVAFDGTNYLVVILDSAGNIRATRVTQGGVALDGGSGQTLISTNGFMGYVDEVQVAFGAGSYLVTWATYTGSPSDVQGALYDPSLALLAGPFTISGAAGGQNHPRVTFGGGNFFVAWDDSRTFGLDIYGARVSPAGTVLDPAGIPITTATYDQSVPTVAYDGTNYFVAWQTTTASSSTFTIQGARVGPTGVLLDAVPIAVSSGAVDDAVPRAAFDGASFVVTHTRYAGTNTAVYANRVSSAGAVLDGTGMVVSAGAWSQDHPAVACSPASCLVAWEDARSNDVDIYGARVHAGALLDPAGIHLSDAAAEQSNPAIAFGNGEYLVVWEDLGAGPDWNIWGARVDPTGVVLDPTGIAISLAVNDQHSPRVAASGSGFLVAWQDARHSGPGYSYTNVFASRVTPAGGVLDPAGIAVNAGEDYTDTPVVASDGAGYVIAWRNSTCPFTGDCIEAARVNAAGALLDATPIAITSSAGDPAIAFGGAQYLIVWDGNAGISGARLTPAGGVVDAAPGFVIGGGDFPSVGFDGVSFVTAYRQYNGSAYQAVATRVSGAGAILDANGVVLSATTFSGYSAAPWRQGPEVTFDGVDSLIVWPAAPSTVYAAWLTPAGVVLSPSTLIASTTSVVDSPAIAARGDGDHSLLTYSFGDPTPGVENYRIKANVITGRSLGHACATSLECKSGFCTDGVCCDTACGGAASNGCQACSVASGAATDGTCAPLSGTACNDGNACTQGDTCQGGTCTAATTTICTPLDACHAAGSCQPATGICTNPAKPNGAACDDGDACTKTSSCQAGVCTGANPVVCAAPAACQLAGVCDPTSGQCAYAAQPDGTTCSDGSACTQGDACQGGVCVAGAPVVCAAPAACHQAGVCDPTSGQCAYAAQPDGTGCDDGSACTTVDVCQAGACAGTIPVVCAAPAACHQAGVCDPISGQCAYAAQADGTGCDDGNACTTVDVCQAGACAGTIPVVCAAPAACHQAGVCDPTSGQCAYAAQADGTGCDDGNACTQSDTCQAGACTGASPVVCAAKDECHAPGACDPGTGQCSTPEKPNGTACTGGTCVGGACTPSGTGGSGAGGSDAGGSVDGGPGAGGAGGGASSSSSGTPSPGAKAGCGCATADPDAPVSGVALLPLLGWLVARRRSARLNLRSSRSPAPRPHPPSAPPPARW